MGSSDPLLSARLKVERAGQHLEALQKETRAFGESQPYRYVTERDPQTGDHVVRLRFRRTHVGMPLRLGLIAGDVVHNLRSALDHLAVQLADRLGSGANDSTQFPVFDNSYEYRRKQDRLLKGVDPRHRAIIESVQPYHVGDRVRAGVSVDPSTLRPAINLLLVARLDNMDKHRLLLPVIPLVEWKQPEFEGVESVSGRYPADYVRVEDGAEVFRIIKLVRSPGAPEVKMKSEVTFGIVFGQAEMGDATMDTLRAFWADRHRMLAGVADLQLALDDVLGVIDRFAPEFD